MLCVVVVVIEVVALLRLMVVVEVERWGAYRRWLLCSVLPLLLRLL
jgi:uncharacterized membrane protein